MPLTAKGEEIKANMVREHGEKAGTSEFYASKNAGTISGVDQSFPPVSPTSIDPAAPVSLGQPAPPEPTDAPSPGMAACNPSMLFDQHDYSADKTSPMGNLPERLSLADMQAYASTFNYNQRGGG